VPDAQDNLTIRADFRDDGAEAGLKRLSDGQERVTTAAKSHVDVIMGASGAVQAQKEFATSAEDVNAILGRIHPSLAAIFEVTRRGTTVVNDVLDMPVGEFLSKAGKGIGDLLPQLRGLAAGGFAAAGISVLVSTLQNLYDEADKLDKRLERMRERQSGEDERVNEIARSVFEESRGRRGGQIDASELQNVRDTVRQILRNELVSDTGTLVQNLAAGYGLVSPQQIEAVSAAGQAVDVGYTPEVTQTRFARQESQHADTIRRRRELIAEERRLKRLDAVREATTDDPTIGTSNIDAVIEGLDATTDPETLRGVAADFFARREAFRRKGYNVPNAEPYVRKSYRAHAAGVEPGGEATAAQKADSTARAMADAVSQTDERIIAEVQELIRKVDALAAQGAEPIVVNHTENNTRNMGVDANAKRQRVRNRARDARQVATPRGPANEASMF